MFSSEALVNFNDNRVMTPITSNPDKINIASFGNYVPHVHFHIMARFKEDSFFPEPMWGKKQREANLDLPSFEIFIDKLKKDF